ncbi:unnamed protein product [Prorocentrum cordatum]|uniref:Amine oxidase domain-containing protein n=1 Tax=Prorocentrum cordatum TaxID=2364126 RepID=A0ABN9XIN9_9DINO|nr:unnamed protein product [Polarella glacialis]
MGGGEAHYLVHGCLGQVLRALAEELGGEGVRLDAAVEEVDYAPTPEGRVRVRYRAGHPPATVEVTARAVVVSVPLGVLKAGTIAFRPPLPPPKLAAIERLDMGLLNKVFLQFEQAWWPADQVTFSYLPPSAPERPGAAGEARGGAGHSYWLVVNCAEAMDGLPVLMALVAPPYSWEMEKESDDAIVADFLLHVVSHVARALPGGWGRPGRPIPAVTARHVTRWGSDPFSLGSYSYLPVGAGPCDREELARAVGDAVFFCGEAAHSLYPSTVHGAYMSGVETAGKVCAALGAAAPDPGGPPAAAGADAAARRARATAPTWAAPLRPPAYKVSWSQLTAAERGAALSLGFDFSSWDHDGPPPPASTRSWARLSAPQRQAARSLGYTAAAWDADSSSSSSGSGISR